MKHVLLLGSIVLVISAEVWCVKQARHTNADQQLFTYIYHNNIWSDPNSVSGTGSNLEETEIIRQELPKLLQTIKARSLVDAPCGDFYWMKELDLSFLTWYVGIDIVEPLIEHNTHTYEKPNRTFSVGDITTCDIPRADVILCRDCFIHLPYAGIKAALKNFKKSGSTYLITSTYGTVKKNRDFTPQELQHHGRCIFRNMQLPPFRFPSPIAIIKERYKGKMLGLWRIADLPDYSW